MADKINPIQRNGIYVTDTVSSYPAAHQILINASHIIREKGFVTISDLATFFGRPIKNWQTTMGWTSLDEASIERCDNFVFPGHGWRIVLPMPTDIDTSNNEKEKNKMNKSVMCKKCIHESCTPGSGCTTCTDCRNASHFVPKDGARFGSDDPRPASYHPTRYTRYENMSGNKIPDIKDVIFNPPATIVLWQDGTKTVVKAGDDDFDPEKGLAMAISKKALGNKGSYYNEFKKWVEPYREKEAEYTLNVPHELIERLKKDLLRRFTIPSITLGPSPFQKPEEEKKPDEKPESEEGDEKAIHRGCVTCKYSGLSVSEHPCDLCHRNNLLRHGAFIMWQPKEPEADVSLANVLDAFRDFAAAGLRIPDGAPILSDKDKAFEKPDEKKGDVKHTCCTCAHRYCAPWNDPCKSCVKNGVKDGENKWEEAKLRNEPEEKNKPAPDPEVRSCMTCKHALVNMEVEPCSSCIRSSLFGGPRKPNFELAE